MLLEPSTRWLALVTLALCALMVLRPFTSDKEYISRTINGSPGYPLERDTISTPPDPMAGTKLGEITTLPSAFAATHGVTITATPGLVTPQARFITTQPSVISSTSTATFTVTDWITPLSATASSRSLTMSSSTTTASSPSPTISSSTTTASSPSPTISSSTTTASSPSPTISSSTTTASSPSPTISSSIPTASAASSSPPLTTHFIVGLGAGLGIPLALMFIGYLMLLAWWHGRHSRNSSTRADTNFQSRIRASFHSMFSHQHNATERRSRALSADQSIVELTAERSIAELATEREAAELEARSAKSLCQATEMTVKIGRDD